MAKIDMADLPEWVHQILSENGLQDTILNIEKEWYVTINKLDDSDVEAYSIYYSNNNGDGFMTVVRKNHNYLDCAVCNTMEIK